jgi:hypothetical protein
MVKSKVLDASYLGEKAGLNTDFILKVKHNLETSKKNTEFHPMDDGKLFYEIAEVDGKTKLKISWGELYYTDSKNQIQKADAEYHVIVTKDERARLDSICALRKDVSKQYVSGVFTTNDTEYLFASPLPGEKYYINVLAKTKDQGLQEGDIVPYHPITFYIPNNQNVSRVAICKLYFHL